LLDGNGSSASAYGAADDFPQGAIANASVTFGIFGAAIIDILDYANTNKYKTIRILSGNDNNGSGTIRFSSGALYSNTNAVSSITLVSGSSGNWSEYSQFALYGIKGA
jgi:subtilase family serine protease